LPSTKIQKSCTYECLYVGYVMLLGRQVICREFSRCYNDVNICLWTNGSELTQTAAQRACERRSSFLPRISNNNTPSKLAQFRSDAENFLRSSGFWIDVKQVDDSKYHWIDGSSLAGLFANCTWLTVLMS